MFPRVPLANAVKIFDALVLGLAGLAAGKLTDGGVTRRQNHPAGLHPQRLRGDCNRILVVICPVDVVPAGFLAVVAPKCFEPLASKRDGAVASNHGKRSQPTQAPLLQVLWLSGVEGILLANAVEVGTVVGAVDGAPFRPAAVATR